MRPGLIAAIILCFFNTIFTQQTEFEQKKITVTGSIELKEVADQASFSFSVKGVGNTLRKAVEDAENKAKKITERIILLGIKKSDISTSEFLSGENYDDKAFLSKNRDYQATIETMIKTDSLDLLKPLLFEISDAEVEKISTISFSLKDELGLRRRARIEAGLKAKEKAEDIANALGVKLGEVLRIEETQTTLTSANQNINLRGSYNPFNPVNSVYFSTSENVDESIGSGFFAKTISVTSQIRVVFSID